MARPAMPSPSPLADKYSPAILNLWMEEDEKITTEWMDKKIADFDAGGPMKEKYETREALDAYMIKTVYEIGGTMDKGLALRDPAVRPKVFFDMTVGGEPIGRIVMQLRKDVVPKTAEVRCPPCASATIRSLSQISLDARQAADIPRHASLPLLLLTADADPAVRLDHTELSSALPEGRGRGVQEVQLPPRHS